MLPLVNAEGANLPTKTIEESLMNRVKEALRRIIDQQNRDHKSNRDAFLDLDRQIKNLNQSLG